MWEGFGDLRKDGADVSLSEQGCREATRSQRLEMTLVS